MPATKSFISLPSKQLCCGCAACANACPKGAISMQPDEEGFLYPHVDSASCVNCGLCEKVCPVLHSPVLKAAPAAYAAKINDTDTLAKSSSGGMFSALALPILKQGGVVFGAGFDKEWNVCHQYVETAEDLDKLRRSKYVQSDIGTTFRQAKQFLDADHPVLFTGTPCQIAGLKNYLDKEYENLLTADIICHGVPSPAVWQKFLKESFPRSTIQAVNFRDKLIGWNKFYLSFVTNMGYRIHGATKSWTDYLLDFSLFSVLTPLVHYNIFLKSFLKELINRPSCHQCHFKGIKSRADFTLGDLWGKWPDSILSKQDKKRGVSVVIAWSNKGKSFLTALNNIHRIPIDLKLVSRFNAAFEFSTQPHPKRAEFFARYQTEPLNKLTSALLGEKPLPIRILNGLWRKVWRKVHRN